MQKLNDLSRSLTHLEPDGTLIAVIEMSQSSWLVAGIVPGIERQPLKKLAVDESALLKLLHRWRQEAEKAGRRIERIAVAFEGFKSQSRGPPAVIPWMFQRLGERIMPRKLCPRCHGQRTTSCLACHGTGKKTVENVQIGNCEECHGTGRRLCDICSGTGEVEP